MYKFSLMLLMQSILASSFFYSTDMDEEMEKRNEMLPSAVSIPERFNRLTDTTDTMDMEMDPAFLPDLGQPSASGEDTSPTKTTRKIRVWKSGSSSSAQLHPDSPFSSSAAACDFSNEPAFQSPQEATICDPVHISQLATNKGYLEIESPDFELNRLGVRAHGESTYVNARIESSVFRCTPNKGTDETVCCQILLPDRYYHYALLTKFTIPEGIISIDMQIPSSVSEQITLSVRNNKLHLELHGDHKEIVNKLLENNRGELNHRVRNPHFEPIWRYQ